MCLYALLLKIRRRLAPRGAGRASASIAGRPERRGQPPAFREFDDVTAVRTALAVAFERERGHAAEKCACPQHWGYTGHVEMYSLECIESALSELPDEADPRVFVEQVHQVLEQLATRFRGWDGDPEGYGLGTIHQVRRVLEARAD